MNPMNLNDFLTWLATGGGAAIALAFILERVPAFQKLSADVKSWINLGGTTALALLAYLALTYAPPDILTTIAPYFLIAGGVFTTWLASQVAHAVDPERKAEAEKTSPPK